MKRVVLFASMFLSMCGHSNEELKMVEQSQIQEQPEFLYKIVSSEDWQKSLSQKEIVNSAMDKDFIHLATEEQLPRIAEKFWKDKDYIILKLITNKLVGRLIYEANPNGATKFYHLYEGTIPLKSVVDVILKH